MRWTVVLAMLCLVGCGEDAPESSTPNGDADASMTEDGGADAGTIADEDATDAVDAAASGTGTIAGNVFYNGAPLPDGVLSVGLVDANPPTTLLRLDELSGVTPPVLYRLEDVPLGTYHVLAFYDVGGDSTWDAPGEGDLVALTQGGVGLEEDGALVENINVELR